MDLDLCNNAYLYYCLYFDCFKIFTKICSYGEKASIFSAAPGALGPLMILAENEKTDLSQVATSHLIRLIIIITVIPFIIVNNAVTETLIIDDFNYMTQNHFNLLILIIASIIFILIFDKIKITCSTFIRNIVCKWIITND